MKKYRIGLFLVIVGVILFVFLPWFNNSSIVQNIKLKNQEGDLTVYTNQEYTLHYPASWGVDEGPNGGVSIHPVDPEILPLQPESPAAYVTIKLENALLSTVRALTASKKGGGDMVESEIMFAGQKAYFYSPTDYPSKPNEKVSSVIFRQIVLEHNNKVYSIFTHKYQLQEVKQILDSFQFLSESSPTPTISKETLPGDIHPNQIVKVVNHQYALVAMPSLNIYLPDIPTDFKAEYRGVLHWNASIQKWEKFLSIQDTNTNISVSNNPEDLWWAGASDTGRVPHLQVVDVNGAGSGEGVAKILAAEDVGLQNWKVIECFDYARDTGKGKNVSVNSKECQAVKISLTN